MKRIIFVLCLFSIIQNFALSQNSSPDGITLGGIIGYGRSMQDHKIKDMPVFEIYGDLFGSGNFTLNGSLEFFQSNYKHPSEFFEYKGVNYTANFNQRWSDISIGAEVLYKVTNYSSLGVGLSMEDIIIKQEYPTANLPFRVNPNNDEVLYFSDKKEINIVRFGISGLGQLEPDFDWIVNPFLQLKYKIIYVGNEYSTNAARTQDMFTISLGFKYKF